MYFDQAQFGKRLKELRLLRGMTQEKMAEVFHCTTDHVGRMERGREGCSIDLLVEIAVYFHVSTDYLLMGKASDLAADRKRITKMQNGTVETKLLQKLNCIICRMMIL